MRKFLTNFLKKITARLENIESDIPILEEKKDDEKTTSKGVLWKNPQKC